MRVMLLTCADPNQVALAHKLADVCDLTGIVVSQNIPRRRRRPGPRRACNAAAARTVGAPLVAAWRAINERYRRQYGGFPDVGMLPVPNVNDAPVVSAIEEGDPDLVAVSGTNLIGRAVLEAASRRRGAVNLHVGLSPYLNGGPNCTNWCLALGRFDLIGSTVMWLNPEIDGGDIIASELTPLHGRETLAELHWAVMEHAHDLYVRCVAALASGASLPGVPQPAVGNGTTFYNAQWTARQMVRARWNFRRDYPSAVGGEPAA
ncbi:MAG TPA: formyltransferase family protein, partial [Actinomycetota bacterium]